MPNFVKYVSITRVQSNEYTNDFLMWSYKLILVMLTFHFCLPRIAFP